MRNFLYWTLLLMLLHTTGNAQITDNIPMQCDSEKIARPPEPDTSKVHAINDELVATLEKGFKIPTLLYFCKLPFKERNRGAYMPQWSNDGRWLSVQTKPLSRKIPCQTKLFYFPENTMSVRENTVVSTGDSTIFYSLRWSRRPQSREFCLIGGDLKLYWGKAEATQEKIVVYRISNEFSNMTQPSWLHISQQDYICFLVDKKIYIGKLSSIKSGKRMFTEVRPLLPKSFSVQTVSYFQPYFGQKHLKILICGESNEGRGLFIVHLKEDMRTVASFRKIDKGNFKLPEWNPSGSKALVYQIKNVSQYSSARDLYLYLFAGKNSGPLLTTSPTIKNREKGIEHDYLGPSWGRWEFTNKDGTLIRVEGVGHYFKKKGSQEKQRFALIYWPINGKRSNYQYKVVHSGQFRMKFGRGRRLVFAGNHSYRLAFAFHSAVQLKNILYLGLMNFRGN